MNVDLLFFLLQIFTFLVHIDFVVVMTIEVISNKQAYIFVIVLYKGVMLLELYIMLLCPALFAIYMVSNYDCPEATGLFYICG